MQGAESARHLAQDWRFSFGEVVGPRVGANVGNAVGAKTHLPVQSVSQSTSLKVYPFSHVKQSVAPFAPTLHAPHRHSLLHGFLLGFACRLHFVDQFSVGAAVGAIVGFNVFGTGVGVMGAGGGVS
jgi:hypothetical protein